MPRLPAVLESQEAPRLACRVIGHAWETLRVRDGVWYRRCRRCRRRRAESYRGIGAVQTQWVLTGLWPVARVRPMTDRWPRTRETTMDSKPKPKPAPTPEPEKPSQDRIISVGDSGGGKEK